MIDVCEYLDCPARAQHTVGIYDQAFRFCTHHKRLIVSRLKQPSRDTSKNKELEPSWRT